MTLHPALDFDVDQTIRDLLEERARAAPEAPYCSFDGRTYGLAEIDERVDRLASGLLGRGFAPGQRVLVMLDQHVDHVVTILALLKLGLVWVPVNVHAKGDALDFLVTHADPAGALVEDGYRAAIAPLLARLGVTQVVWRAAAAAAADPQSFERLAASEKITLAHRPAAGDVLCISYSSGTTGEPKGSQVTDLALRMSARTCMHVGDMAEGDVLFLWEPLHHLGGAQVLMIALMARARFAMVSRFSASRFWDQVRDAGATHIHYLGGVLAILLKQPVTEAERRHRVRIAWGGGCPRQVYEAVRERYALPVHEGYGLTEVSSFVTANRSGKPGSMGRPLPMFELRLVDENGLDASGTATGEIVVRPVVPGIASIGYFRNPEADRAMRRDGWVHTGDLAYRDAEGDLFYAGRKKDSVRRRGENISAWEVERVVNQHAAVEECALVGVPNDLGDEDLKLFVRPAPGATLDFAELARWCAERMPYFQVPRYFRAIDEFARTPTQRIRKAELSRDVEDSFDAEAAGRGRPQRAGAD